MLGKLWHRFESGYWEFFGRTFVYIYTSFRPNSLRKPLKKSLIFWKYDVTRMFPHNPQIPTLNHENIEVIDRRRVVFNLSVRKPPNWLYFQCKIPLYELLITGPLLSPQLKTCPLQIPSQALSATPTSGSLSCRVWTRGSGNPLSSGGHSTPILMNTSSFP